MPYEARIHCCNSLHQKLMLVGHREPYGGQVCVCVCWPVCGPLGVGQGGGNHPPTCAVPLSWLSARFLPHTPPPWGTIPHTAALHLQPHTRECDKYLGRASGEIESN